MAGKAANGDGSCKQVLSGRLAGKWRVQVTLQDAQGAKKRLSRLFDTQRDGKAFLRSLERETDRAVLAATKPMTVGNWFKWLAENDWPESLTPFTIKTRQARFRKYAEARWGNVPLVKVDPLEVREFYVRLREDGIGQATREGVKGDLVRAFNQAISPYRRVPATLANPFCVPIDAKVSRDAVALTPDQAKKALKSSTLDDNQRAILATMLLGGLRLGEMMALTARQVDFGRGLILVDQAVSVEYGGAQSVGLPKGGKKRVAVMCQTLGECLKAITMGHSPETFLFAATTSNQPRMKKLVYATWRTIVKDAKLPTGMTPHDCRLSHINWIEKLLPEVSATTLKEHVGHAAIGVTEINYTRPISPAQDLLRQGLERLLV